MSIQKKTGTVIQYKEAYIWGNEAIVKAIVGWEEAVDGNTINPNPFQSALETTTAYSFKIAYLKGEPEFPMRTQVTAVFDTAGQ